MANIGADPIDSSTPVGQVRLNVGDTNCIPLDPPVDGQADYANFSDAELGALLTTSDGNVLRATAWAWAKLAALAAAKAVTIKTNDLGYTKERSATELRALADWWKAEADYADEITSDDLLEIVHFAGFDHSASERPNVL